MTKTLEWRSQVRFPTVESETSNFIRTKIHSAQLKLTYNIWAWGNFPVQIEIYLQKSFMEQTKLLQCDWDANWFHKSAARTVGHRVVMVTVWTSILHPPPTMSSSNSWRQKVNPQTMHAENYSTTLNLEFHHMSISFNCNFLSNINKRKENENQR